MGFTRIYQLLMRRRDDLLAADGPLAHFRSDEVRVLLRPTRTYGMLLRESFHPDVLRNALDRDRLLDRLWMYVVSAPFMARIVHAEQQELHNGDIPIFVTHPDARDLWSGTGERFADFFDEPGFALVERRISQLNESDLLQQLWCIRASLATLAGGDFARTAPAPALPPRQPAQQPHHAVTKARILAAGRLIGDRLEALVLRGEHDLSWIGLTARDNGRYALSPLGIDLYDGLPGVVLFLAYLGDMTHEPRYTALAQRGFQTLRHYIERGATQLRSIGGFTGWGGLVTPSRIWVNFGTIRHCSRRRKR